MGLTAVRFANIDAGNYDMTEEKEAKKRDVRAKMAGQGSGRPRCVVSYLGNIFEFSNC